MSICRFLNPHAEPMPTWLANFRHGQAFSPELFFGSRVVYYPGSGNDGHAVKLFGGAHSAHCFVYCDYGYTQSRIERELEHPVRAFRGYRSFSRIHAGSHEVALPPSADRGMLPNTPGFFGFLEVLERIKRFGDSHGPERLAILFLRADGHEYLRAFSQQGYSNPPYAILIEDYGFGGNYDRFGRGGKLEQLAIELRCTPEWLLVGRDAPAWQSYQRVHGLAGKRGGWHGYRWVLYKKNH